MPNRQLTAAVAIGATVLLLAAAAGPASAGAAPSWNQNEALSVPADGSVTVYLTVNSDIADDSITERAEITPSEEIADHVSIENNGEVGFEDGDTQQVEIVIETDELEQGDAVQGSLLLEHYAVNNNGDSSKVGLSYSFDLGIQTTEPDGFQLNSTNPLSWGLIAALVALLGLLWVWRRILRDDNPSTGAYHE